MLFYVQMVLNIFILSISAILTLESVTDYFIKMFTDSSGIWRDFTLIMRERALSAIILTLLQLIGNLNNISMSREEQLLLKNKKRALSVSVVQILSCPTMFPMMRRRTIQRRLTKKSITSSSNIVPRKYQKNSTTNGMD